MQKYIVTTCKCGCYNTFGLVCMSVCSVRALTFESLDLATSFSVYGYNFEISKSSSYIKVNWSKSRPQEHKGGIYNRN